jgi:hypothetical protein
MTQYGACYDGSSGVCATQKLDCAAGETWLEPKDALALYGFECACDDVLVGACESSTGTKTCAVDADSCDAGDSWLDARAVAAEGASCTLCGRNTPFPSPAPTRAPVEAVLKADDDDDGSATLLVVVVVVVAVVALAAVAGLVFLARRPGGSPLAVVQAEAHEVGTVELVTSK